ncbi:Ribosomal protein S5 domain 2-type protein [Coniochaeta hoffmannii]|uniref:Ribosomal RNA-processing protein 42 n=1 Tax=Coniochaeta hoffmannii TaxID=91930 RepID=A0AA38RT17_9PEZI|nr:Ribosomal protein S5 domain 2-type protein [Coniochaeta hoffmannii]
MSTTHILLSPAELAYLHASLSLLPPLRPDGRAPNQFRPVSAETGVLPGANGSARVCFADGTEAIVGVKAEVEKTRARLGRDPEEEEGGFDPVRDPVEDDDDNTGGGGGEDGRAGHSDWVEMTVEIPGQRDDEASTIFLAAMLSEALLADGEFVKRLYINRRFHWKLYLDILLISPPLSYPLPLLSLTTHLALLATRLPRLKSEGDEDPLFDDDWAMSDYLYPRLAGKAVSRPPLTLLVIAVGSNIIFDPAKEELAVADVALAVSVGEAVPGSESSSRSNGGNGSREMEIDPGIGGGGRSLRLLSVRTIDPPSRLTPPGVPNEKNTAYGAAGVSAAASQKQAEARAVETENVEGVWKAPRGGAKVLVMASLVDKCLEKGGVADEVFDALEAVDLG